MSAYCLSENQKARLEVMTKLNTQTQLNQGYWMHNMDNGMTDRCNFAVNRLTYKYTL